MRVASTAVSMVAWPLIMMTGMVSRPAVDHSLSSVTPSVSGIQMSSSTRSGRARWRAARASAAFSASSTLWPSSLRISKSRSRMPSSSSTTSMFAMNASLCALQATAAVRGASEGGLICGAAASATAASANDNETCAPTTAPSTMRFGKFDARAVLVGDFLDDRQAQAGALGLGGDVGLEGALEDVLGKAGPAVLHRQAHPLARVAPAGCAPARPRRRARCRGGRLGRVLRVLQQVVDDLAQLLRVAADRRAARGRARSARATAARFSRVRTGAARRPPAR